MTAFDPFRVIRRAAVQSGLSAAINPEFDPISIFPARGMIASIPEQ